MALQSHVRVHLRKKQGLQPRRCQAFCVPRKEIEYALDLSRQLKNVDKIFARVFSAKKSRDSKALKKPRKRVR